MKTPLARPELPAHVDRRPWGSAAVCVFGGGALSFARLLAQASGWTLARVELRHAPGHTLTRTPEMVELSASPLALDAARRALREEVEGPLVAAHAPLAALLDAPAIWISGGRSILGVPAPLRTVARDATLVLEEARPDTARQLGAALALTAATR